MAGSAILVGVGAPGALAAGKPAAHAVAAHPADAVHPAGAAGGLAARRAATSRPAAGHVRMSPASLAEAAASCASWASNAGFANNGYLGGSLTTAVAVALAESGCDQAACWDGTTGRSCTQSTEDAGDLVDRGAWQLGNKGSSAVSDSCAYRGQCSADVAYTAFSLYGTYFDWWPRYRSDNYASYLWPAQQAVNALRQGTVTSALIGSCLAYQSDQRGALVKLENCGTGAANQMWTVRGSTLRTESGLCLSATAMHVSAPLEVRTCDLSTLQGWELRSGDTLRNAGSGLCLSIPGSSTVPGLVLDDAPCELAQNQAWFRP